MCYHKSLNVAAPELEARYEAVLPPDAGFQPVYHANAYQFPAWPIVTRQEPGKLQLVRWGLIPHWAKTAHDAADIRARTINARSETIYEKPSYRQAARKGQRCLIPITGFYEWHTVGNPAKSTKKFPFYITATDASITSVAGLWDEWPDPETGELIRTYTLLTTDANSLLAVIHNTKKRMPCVLTAKAEQVWLHDELTETDALALLAEQYPADRMHSYSISKRISARNEPSDVPEVMAPAEYPELKNEPMLFT